MHLCATAADESAARTMCDRANIGLRDRLDSGSDRDLLAASFYLPLITSRLDTRENHRCNHMNHAAGITRPTGSTKRATNPFRPATHPPSTAGCRKPIVRPQRMSRSRPADNPCHCQPAPLAARPVALPRSPAGACWRAPPPSASSWGDCSPAGGRNAAGLQTSDRPAEAGDRSTAPRSPTSQTASTIGGSFCLSPPA